MSKKFFKLVNKKKVYKIVASFPEPKDCLERAYFQYLCHKKLFGRLLSCCANARSKLQIKRTIEQYKSNYNENEDKIRVDAVLFDVLGLSIVPDSLKREFQVLHVADNFKGMLNAYDIEYLREVQKRFPQEHRFVVQIIHTLAKYRSILNVYDVKAIIATDEIDFARTALTDFCRKHEIKHIGVMHGMKWAEQRSTFFEFDRFYVWENFFKELCIKLGAADTQFVVETPDSVKFRFEAFNIADKALSDYKFYLTISNKRELKNIKRVIQALRHNNETALIRPHPRYTDMRLLESIFDKAEIEYPAVVPINESVFFAKNIVSIDSTVLYQAFRSGKTAIVDDISNPKRTKRLRDVDFIMLNKLDRRLLSATVKGCVK